MINTHRSEKASKLPPAMPIPLLDLKLQYASIREEKARRKQQENGYDEYFFHGCSFCSRILANPLSVPA